MRKQSSLHKASSTCAFTLLEVLVVLVIISLLGTLILQGFSYAITLRSKASIQLGRVHKQELVESWFRKSVSSLHLKDKLPDEPIDFYGTPKQFRGNSFVDLESEQGLLSSIQWSIELTNDGSSRLLYARNSDFDFTASEIGRDSIINISKDYWVLAEWPSSQATFSYLDKKGDWHDYWPPHDYKDELPSGVMLRVQNQLSPFFWYSRIQGTKRAKILYFL